MLETETSNSNLRKKLKTTAKLERSKQLNQTGSE